MIVATMRLSTFLVLALLAALSGCDSNPTYIKLATEHMAKGPRAACCTGTGGFFTGGDACATEAEKKCAYARDAKVTFVSISEAGNAARNVTFDVAGPNGKAECIVFIGDRGKGNGGIRVEKVTCTQVREHLPPIQ